MRLSELTLRVFRIRAVPSSSESAFPIVSAHRLPAILQQLKPESPPFRCYMPSSQYRSLRERLRESEGPGETAEILGATALEKCESGEVSLVEIDIPGANCLDLVHGENDARNVGERLIVQNGKQDIGVLQEKEKLGGTVGEISSGSAEYTDLHLAAYRDDVERVKLLLNEGANVNCKARNGSTPLHWAAGAGALECVKLLLSQGADPTIRSYTWEVALGGKGSGQTALHWAAESGHQKIVLTMLEWNPELALYLDERRQSPRQLAVRNAHSDINRVLSNAELEKLILVEIRGEMLFKGVC